MDERRGERRVRVLREGRVVLTDTISLNCIVRDLSAGGARLQFEGSVYLPVDFRLKIVSADLSVPATPAWQRQGEAGIRFTGVATVGYIEGSAEAHR